VGDEYVQKPDDFSEISIIENPGAVFYNILVFQIFPKIFFGKHNAPLRFYPLNLTGGIFLSRILAY
jgi:hypothetical protein